mmetsp:Transcript_22546/g.27781  ORF Transcript_22546/g.27781 Transcript_22546/m.27781 type:complete len:619 (+) Transcript_22546:30-1886(+)
MNIPAFHQKRNGTPLQDNGDKRSRVDGPTSEYFIEQRLVGWIIGKGGATLKEIEQGYQVKVSLDQSSKGTGYSKVLISGPEAQISQAVSHINSSLSAAGYGDGVNAPCLLVTLPTGDNGKEDIQVKQRYIGYLLGSRGAAISDIEKASGCQIFVNQETKTLGYSIVQLCGLPEQIADARQAIELAIDRAKAAREGKETEEQIQVEQRCVGWLLGKKGGLVQEIQQETGAQIHVDQSTSTLGYSTVTLKGMADQVDSARDRVNAALDKVGATPLTAKAVKATAGGAPPMGGSRGSSINTQVTVEQQWVGWLLGKNGAAIRELEGSTGAKISVNQDTKAQGFSTIALSGTPLQVQAAYDAMTESLRRAGGYLSELPAWLTSTAGHGSSHGRGRESGLTDAVLLLASSLVEHSGQDALWRVFPTLQDTLHAHPDVVQTLKSLVPLRSGAGDRPHLGHNLGQQVLDLQVEQKLVGWLVGGRGKTVQQIQDETGAKISIDQSTKDAGYSIVHVSGSMTAVQQAERRIQSSISLVNAPKQGDFRQDAETTEMEVEQRLVGWILGKSGMVLREIETQSGASVSIDQSTKELGFSKVRMTGGFAQRVSARRLIEEKVMEANSAGPR